MQAEAQIRAALNSDELALIAIDTLARLPSKLGQQDLATMTTTSRRRSVAFFDAVSRHLTTWSGRTGVAHLVALSIAPAEPGTRSGRAPAGAGPRGPETFDEWLRRTQGSVDAPGSLRS